MVLKIFRGTVIVYAEGKIWIHSDHYDERMRLYKKEGIKVDEKGKITDFHSILYTFE